MSDVQAKKMWLPEAMELMQDLRVENEALQARIDELESQVQWFKDNIEPEDRYVKRIKAEGIEEAKQYAMDNKPSVECEFENYCNFVNLIDEYRDKLEKGG